MRGIGRNTWDDHSRGHWVVIDDVDEREELIALFVWARAASYLLIIDDLSPPLFHFSSSTCFYSPSCSYSSFFLLFPFSSPSPLPSYSASSSDFQGGQGPGVSFDIIHPRTEAGTGIFNTPSGGADIDSMLFTLEHS